MVLLLWIICVISVLCLSCFRVCSLLPCGDLMGKGWPLGSRLWCLIVFLSLSHVVSWVMCGTWLYRLLIFAPFLTLMKLFNYNLRLSGIDKLYAHSFLILLLSLWGFLLYLTCTVMLGSCLVWQPTLRIWVSLLLCTCFHTLPTSLFF